MRAGNLNRTISLQSVETVQNSVGQPVETWATYAENVPADYRPNRGGERFTAQQVMGKAIATFVIRWRPMVTIEDRLLYDTKYWDIHDVRELGFREGLEIDASVRAET